LEHGGYYIPEFISYFCFTQTALTTLFKARGHKYGINGHEGVFQPGGGRITHYINFAEGWDSTYNTCPKRVFMFTLPGAG